MAFFQRIYIGSFVSFSFLVGCEQAAKLKHNEYPSNYIQLIMRGSSIRRMPSEKVEQAGLSLTGENSRIFNILSDQKTGALRMIQYDTSQMDTIRLSDLDRFIATWFEENKLKIGSDLQTIDMDSLKKIRINEKYLTVSFSQTVDGVKVRGGFFEFIFSFVEDEFIVLREARSELYRLEELAENQIKKELDLSPADIDSMTGWDDAVVLKRELLYIPSIDYDLELHLVTKLSVSAHGAGYELLVRHFDKKLIEISQRKLAVNSKISGRVFERSYLDADTIEKPLPLTKVYSSGASEISDFDAQLSKGDPIDFVELVSPRVKVYKGTNKSPSKLDVDAMGTSGPVVEKVSPELNAYHSIHKINRYVRQYLSSDELPFLDYPLEVRVDVDGGCNAFYTTVEKKISLYGEQSGCANFSLINDVIYHEWGHGLDEHTGRSLGITDGAFSEGISDTLASYITGSPLIGRGYISGNNRAIRDLRDRRVYPDDVSTVHHEGGIISGVFWSLRQELIKRYGFNRGVYLAGKLFLRHLLVADTYHDSYEAVMLLDDDDGNPATPSPNRCLINAIFADRGLANPLHCDDPAVLPRELNGVEEDLRLAIYDLEKGYFGMVASSAMADQLEFCVSQNISCSQGQGLTQMSPVGGNDRRMFFSVEVPILLKQLDLVTLIAKNAEGSVIGSRVIKVVGK